MVKHPKHLKAGRDFSLAAYHMYLFSGMVLELYSSSHATLKF